MKHSAIAGRPVSFVESTATAVADAEFADAYQIAQHVDQEPETQVPTSYLYCAPFSFLKQLRLGGLRQSHLAPIVDAF